MKDIDPFYVRVVGYGVLAVLACVVMLLPILVRADVPDAAQPWKRELTRQARLEWGLDAPVATIAAQIEQESAFDPQAQSAAGAEGLAQFMPATAAWISGAYPALAANEPSNPIWALRAVATYDHYLWERVNAIDPCNRFAKVLSSYNGGENWLHKDEALAASKGLWPEYWWDSVETVNAGRAIAFWRENRGYPRRILRTLEPEYVDAGWGPGFCEVTR